MLAPFPGYTTQEAVDAATALIVPNALPNLPINDLAILFYTEDEIEDNYAEVGLALYEAAQKAGNVEDEKENEDVLIAYAHEAHEIACRRVYAAIADQLRAVVDWLPEDLTFVANPGSGSGSKFWHTAFADHWVCIGNLEDNEMEGYTDFVARLLTRGCDGETAHQGIGSLQVLARIQDAANPNQSRLIAWQEGEQFPMKKVDVMLKSKQNNHREAREALQKYFADYMGVVGDVAQARLLQRYGDFEVLFDSKDNFYFIDFGGFRHGAKVFGSKAKRVKTPAGEGQYKR